jgi:hypothetical protein
MNDRSTLAGAARFLGSAELSPGGLTRQCFREGEAKSV